MTVDIEKARALVEELRSVDISWSDDGEAAAEAADTIDALLNEVEHWKAESASWEKQASDRVDDALKFAAERDALMSLIRDEIDENARLRDLGGAAADENITAMIKRVIAERDALARDAARFDWYFGRTDKIDFMQTYLTGMKDGWTPDQWRAAIDAAMKGASDE